MDRDDQGGQRDRPMLRILRPDRYVSKRERGGGGERKVHADVTPELRRMLSDQIQGVREHIMGLEGQFPGVPKIARLLLRETALAKSHRPSSLFRLCPVVGGGDFGEIFLRVNDTGLRAFNRLVIAGQTNNKMADISSVSEIGPWTAAQKMHVSMKGAAEWPVELKVELFGLGEDDARNQSAFEEHLQRAHLEFSQLDYGERLIVYRVQAASNPHIDWIAQYPSVRQMGTFPAFCTVDPSSGQALNAAIQPARPVPDHQYPIVGLIDSGVDPANPFLSPWVVSRAYYVPPPLRNYDHGTFVAGLLVFGDLLDTLPLPTGTNGVWILDVVAAPDNKKGSLSEPEFIAILNEVIPKYPHIKVWNMSLGLNWPCDSDQFSHLATVLDELSDRYGVTFVNAAGNCSRAGRDWSKLLDDVISPPGDAVRSITVGSIAHRSSADADVPQNYVSSFSRRGPGPHAIVKPEVVHFGGNKSSTGGYEGLGVVSTLRDGIFAFSGGTSFSAPRVTSLAAYLASSLSQGMSRNLIRALLAHKARYLHAPTRDLKAENLNYYGFGVPAGLDELLACGQRDATIVIEGQIASGFRFEIPDFPFPPSLQRADHWRADVSMTLAYDPPLDPAFGLEYIRVDLEASLGVYHDEVDEDGVVTKTSFDRRVPPSLSWEGMYEKSRITHGFKWSPIKSYERTIHRVAAERWGLRVECLERSGFNLFLPQQFCLLLTLSDPEGLVDMYGEVLAHLLSNNHLVSPVNVRADLRLRA